MPFEGILGFLYDGNEIQGNLGLLDQKLALQWVSSLEKSIDGLCGKIHFTKTLFWIPLGAAKHRKVRRRSKPSHFGGRIGG